MLMQLRLSNPSPFERLLDLLVIPALFRDTLLIEVLFSVPAVHRTTVNVGIQNHGRINSACERTLGHSLTGLSADS
jgi:hypothetical protein